MSEATMTAAPAPNRSLRARIADVSSRHRSTSVIIGMSITTVALYFLAYVPPFSLFLPHASWLDSFAGAGVVILLALGLNIVVGFAGLLDLGYAAFFAIGAYTYAYGASPFFGLHFPFIPMLVVGAAVAAIFGIILGAPTLRLRGDYLAIVTLGFGEIVPLVFLIAEDYSGGPSGISGVDRPDLWLPIIGQVEFGALTPHLYFFLVTAIVTLAMVLIYRLQDARIGRAWAAVREDELAAAANGINTVTTKLLAFALGATTAGFAGVFAASRLTLVSPEQFTYLVSFAVLAMVILGGMGNIWGVAAGAFIVYIIQSVVLRQLSKVFDQIGLDFLAAIDYPRYQFLLFGLALVLMTMFRPEGLFPSQRRRRELHVGDELSEDEGDGEIVGALGPTPGSDELLGSEGDGGGLR
jgi:branched-chain amino acid transport system permease protein